MHHRKSSYKIKIIGETRTGTHTQSVLGQSGSFFPGGHPLLHCLHGAADILQDYLKFIYGFIPFI